jgi:Class II flagellar assembly regulator.
MSQKASEAMEVNGPSKVDRTSGVRRGAKSASAGSSSSTFTVSSAPEEPHASMVAGPGPIAALDSILALQSLEDSTDGRSRGLKHGEQLLDMLDQVRDGLLAGGIPRATLNRLANAVSRRHEQFADPRLQSVLDEIELRAHVELAKLEMLDKRTA